MNRKRISLVLAITAVFVLSVLCWLAPWSRTSQAAPAPSGEAAFKGKVLLISTSNMMTVAFLLEKAQVQKIGDRSFLVGKGAAEGKMAGWYKGRTVRLQLEHIVSITEFDDLKEAKRAMESGGGIPFGGYSSVPVDAPAPSLPGTAPVPAGAPLPPAVKP